MSGDTRIILAIVGVGLALAGLILQQMNGFGSNIAVLRDDMGVLRDDVEGLRTEVTGLRSEVAGLRTEVRELRDDVADLRERVTRIETLLEYALTLPSDPPSEQPPGA